MENNFEENIIAKSQLLQVVFSFQWIFSIMGINLPPLLYYLKNDSKKNLINCLKFGYLLYACCLIALVIWIVYINNVVVDYVVFSNDLDSITSVLSISINIIVAFVQVIAQTVAIIKRQYLQMIFIRIAQLEKDILLYYREYQWFTDDELYYSLQQRCQKFSRFIIIRFGLFCVLFGIGISYVNYHLVATIMDLQDKIITLFYILALQFKSVEYCIIIQIVDELLGSLQNSLKQIKWEMAKIERKSIMVTFFHEKLMANQFLLNRVWFLITKIEEYFAIPMLMLYLYNGIAITHTINWSYVRSFDYRIDDIDCGLFRLYYILFTFLNMFLPCWLTQSCIDKYNQFGAILHNLKTIDDSALNLRVREYSLQLRHQEILFTCSGYFNINLKYFGLMILSISTYVAILIQFKLQKESEKANIRL
ncbi:putative gustatory receptor 98b [Cochliomyia hominivorax]